MSDDLDNLIRAAMKTLDEQVPSGYFEGLPNQTLARLEGSSMQHGPGTTGVSDNVVPPPMELDTSPVPKQADRDEDSGLHDIRNLAQSTKQRLSSKRITQSPPMKDEDVLASSSGSWKNIALPQPAKMVSLPELTELPSKKEVLAAEKAADKAARKAAKSAPAIQDDASVSLSAVAATESPLASASTSSAAVPERAAFSLPSMQQRRSKAPLFAILGIGVAAAAGGVIYMQMNKSESAKSAPAVASVESRDQGAALKAPEQPAAAAAPAERQKTDEEIKAEAALEAAKAEAAKAEADAAAAGAAAPTTTTAVEEKPEAHKMTKTAVSKGKKEVHKDAETETTKVEVKPEPQKQAPKGGDKKEGSGEGEPSFDALLKEAGVDENKKADKPKLEKKSLTGEDFKTGMAAIAAKAQACYKGTQGTAPVKLTIAPSGAVTKVSVGGAFSGKPEAACVEAAVKGAHFPPWDGGPMSFTYAYMLSD